MSSGVDVGGEVRRVVVKTRDLVNSGTLME